MGAASDFWVQAGAGGVAALLAFLAAWLLFRWQRNADKKAAEQVRKDEVADDKAAAKIARKGLLTYLAAELRRNRDLTWSMAGYLHDAPLKIQAIGKGFQPYRALAFGDQAYHACMADPRSGLADDEELLDALVDCYSAVPVWRSYETSLATETHSADSARIENALLGAHPNHTAALGQFQRFARCYDLLEARGFKAHVAPNPATPDITSATPVREPGPPPKIQGGVPHITMEWPDQPVKKANTKKSSKRPAKRPRTSQ